MVRGRKGIVRGCGAGWIVEMLLRGTERRIWGKVGSGERGMELEQWVMDAVAGICGMDAMRLAVAKAFEFAGSVEFFVGRHAMSGQRCLVEEEAASMGTVKVFPEAKVVVTCHRCGPVGRSGSPSMRTSRQLRASSGSEGSSMEASGWASCHVSASSRRFWRMPNRWTVG